MVDRFSLFCLLPLCLSSLLLSDSVRGDCNTSIIAGHAPQDGECLQQGGTGTIWHRGCCNLSLLGERQIRTKGNSSTYWPRSRDFSQRGVGNATGSQRCRPSALRGQVLQQGLLQPVAYVLRWVSCCPSCWRWDVYLIRKDVHVRLVNIILLLTATKARY